jgi:hypothetical protein
MPNPIANGDPVQVERQRQGEDGHEAAQSWIEAEENAEKLPPRFGTPPESGEADEEE